ncbi:MAG: hypothetical protein U0941_13305 [Planctomycetaceae bacterium]
MSKATERECLLAEMMDFSTLDELKPYLAGRPAAELRRDLWSLFQSRCEYHNAIQWAEAVRLCEALTIIGWGKHEQVDAVCEKRENGWHTMFLNAQGDYRFLYGGWTKRKAGFALHNPQYYASPDRPGHPDIDWLPYGSLYGDRFSGVSLKTLPTQRNRRRLSPLQFGGIQGRGKTSEMVFEMGLELHQVMKGQICADSYGSGLSLFDFCLVTWTDQGNLKPGLKLGRYLPKVETYRCYLQFDSQFHKWSRDERVAFIASNLLLAVDHATSCLQKCGVGYDMVRFREDVHRGLKLWSEMGE